MLPCENEMGHLGVGVPLLGVVVLKVVLVVVELGRGVLLGVVVKPLELGLGLVPLQGFEAGAPGVVGICQLK